jgi:hypothetical protein
MKGKMNRLTPFYMDSSFEYLHQIPTTKISKNGKKGLNHARPIYLNGKTELFTLSQNRHFQCKI